jgi:shikimate kinase
MHIVLCGFQGVGKSYFGRRISEKTGLPFRDSDEKLSRKFHASPRDVYRKLGKEKFREEEEEAIFELLVSERGVIALGGGALESKKTEALIEHYGRLFYLFLPFEELQERQKGKERALYLNPNETFYDFFFRRDAVFISKAHATIPLLARTEKEVIEEIIRYGRQ